MAQWCRATEHLSRNGAAAVGVDWSFFFKPLFLSGSRYIAHFGDGSVGESRNSLGWTWKYDVEGRELGKLWGSGLGVGVGGMGWGVSFGRSWIRLTMGMRTAGNLKQCSK